MATQEKCKTKQATEINHTLDSDSEDSMTLSGMFRKRLEVRGWRRRCRQIISSDDSDENSQKEVITTPITSSDDLQGRTAPATAAAFDLKKPTNPKTTPLTSTKKRAASEVFPSPPPTKKTIRINIRSDGNDKLKVATVEHKKPSKMKRNNKPRPIVLSKSNKVDNTLPVHHEPLTPQQLWEEKRFDLSSPRLIRPLPQRYKLIEETGPLASGPDSRVFIPDVPADDIRKVLSINPSRAGMRWAGGWAKGELAREVAMYERVKGFWLFNYGYAYCPSWDFKHEFVAAEFAEEMQRPRVVAWLAELIGREDVCLVLEYLEGRMAKELERMGVVEDREDEDDEREEVDEEAKLED